MGKMLRVFLIASSLLLVLVSAGCNGGTSAPNVSIALQPGVSQEMDEAQSVAISANLSNDTGNKGVSWDLNGPGTLSNNTTISVTYHAPATVNATTTATVTATSVTNTRVSVQLAITIHPSPQVATTSLPDGSLNTAYSATLQASEGTGAYAWNVTSGSLPAWASLDAKTGVISGTPDVSGTANFSVAVTDDAGIASDDQALSLTVPGFSVSSTSLPDGVVGVPYAAELAANGGVEPYSWSVSAGTLPSWANLDAGTGIISGTPDASDTSTFTIQATDSSAAPQKALRALSITIAAASTGNELVLQGQYAFLLRGFDDDSGSQFGIAGSFVADGNGKITSGLEDVNGPDGYQPSLKFTGTYEIGPDNRGYATFTNSLDKSTVFAIAVGKLNSSKVATGASLIEFDDETGTEGKRASGFAAMQGPVNFDLAKITGPYAFQLAGQYAETDTRTVVTGAFTTDGKGNVTGGQEDSNDGGHVANLSFTGTFSTTTNTSSFGRVTLDTLTNGITGHSVMYIVSASRAFLLTADPEARFGLMSGEVRAQASYPYTAASLGGMAVGYGVGQLAINAGLWTFDGSANASYSLVWSDASFIHPGPEMGSLSFTVSANGRVTTAGGSVAPGVPGEPIFYLVDANKGFLMSTDSSVASGFFEPQTGAPFSNASLSGSYYFGTVTPAVTGSVVASGVGTSSGDGTLNLTVEQSSPLTAVDQSSTIVLLVEGKQIALHLSIGPTGFGPDEDPFVPGIVYMISPKKFVVVLNGPGWPMITVFEQ